MTAKRIVMLLGAIALAVGLIALLVPVSVTDNEGNSVGCGNAIAADLSEAQAANDRSVADVPILEQIIPHTDFVELCESALSSRRSWSIPVAVIGALAIVGALFIRERRGSPGAA